MKTTYKVCQKVKMTEDALDNYGQEYKDVIFIITSRATKYMPSQEFYSKGMPKGYHPGYDVTMAAMGLYDLKRADNNEDLNFSLYGYELEIA